MRLALADCAGRCCASGATDIDGEGTRKPELGGAAEARWAGAADPTYVPQVADVIFREYRIWDRPHLRRKHGLPERFEAVEDPSPNSEGYRVIWDFIAVTVHALIEREVRDAMKARGIRSIPLYPEERACRAPTADKILGLFEPLRHHRLFDGNRVIKTFWEELSDIQRLVLDLLHMPTAAYGESNH